MAMDEFKLTWNLVLSGFMFPIIIYMISRLGNDASTRSADMKKKIEELTECVNNVNIKMERKLDRDEHDDECKEKNTQIWNRMNFHSHDEKGNVVIPGGIK